MYDIKDYLKSIGITKQGLSEQLKLSRQTLDNYIDLYECDTSIPKEKYQVIFKRLFTNPPLNADDFSIMLTTMSNLLDRDEKYGLVNLTAEDTDIVTGIVSKMARDLQKKDCNREIYSFVSYTINSYRVDDVWQLMASYILVLNGGKEPKGLSNTEKAFFSSLYDLVYKYKNGKLEYDEMLYKAFLNKRNELIHKKANMKLKVSNSLMAKMEEIIQESTEQGVELTEEKLIQKLKER